MKFKPLMLMRARGLAGPFFSKHHGISGLSKSAGNFIGVFGALRPLYGFTGSSNCATIGSPYTVKFSGPVYFTNYAGVNFYNVTQGIPGTGISSALTQGLTEIEYTVYWAQEPVFGDVIEFRYAGGDYGDLPVGDPERVLMENTDLRLRNCHPQVPIFTGMVSDIIYEENQILNPVGISKYFLEGGAPTSYSLTDWPSGVVIDNNGIISGTPTGVGSYTSYFTGTNDAGSDDSNTFTVEVVAEVFAPIFTGTIADITAYFDTPISIDVSGNFSTGGQPNSYSLTNNPSWMTISNGGVISGTATSEGTHTNMTVTAINQKGSAVSNEFTTTASSAITTKMLTFDGATSYGELAELWVSTDANATEDIEFVAVGTDYNLTNGIAVVVGALSMDAGITSALLDGVSIGITGAIPNDGKLHTLTVGGTFNLTHISATSTPDNFFGSIIKSVTLTDNTTPANSRIYTLDSGSIEYELPDGVSEGSELITNGTFDTDLTGWSDNPGTSTWVDGEAKLSETLNNKMAQPIAGYTAGMTFYVTCTARTVSGNGRINGDAGISHHLLAEGFNEFIFTATNTAYNKIEFVTLLEGSEIYVDNVSVKELPQALIYNNVTPEDWGNYTYNESSIDCSGGPGWESTTKPTVCEVV